MACGKAQEMLVIETDTERVCRPYSPDYMSWVIAIEIFFLLVVLTKLIFDIWHYNRTGQMPWLARHLCLGVSNTETLRNGGKSERGKKGLLCCCCNRDDENDDDKSSYNGSCNKPAGGSDSCNYSTTGRVKCSLETASSSSKKPLGKLSSSAAQFLDAFR